MELLNELSELNHNAFIKFYEMYSLPKSDGSYDYCLAMEYGLMTLKESLEIKKYTTPEIIHILSYLVDGLIKAQEQKIVNADIKPDNIILIQEKNDKFTYKFIDFGVGYKVEGNQDNMVSYDKIRGLTTNYAAPEILPKSHDKFYDPFQADHC